MHHTFAPTHHCRGLCTQNHYVDFFEQFKGLFSDPNLINANFLPPLLLFFTDDKLLKGKGVLAPGCLNQVLTLFFQLIILFCKYYLNFGYVRNKRNIEMSKNYIPALKDLGFWLIANQQYTVFGWTETPQEKRYLEVGGYIRIKSGWSTLCQCCSLNACNILPGTAKHFPSWHSLPLCLQLFSSRSQNSHTPSQSAKVRIFSIIFPSAHQHLGQGLPHMAPHHKTSIYFSTEPMRLPLCIPK